MIEMWSVDMKVLTVINYGGLHIYRLGASPALLDLDFNTLVSWQSMNDMLVINIIYAAKGELRRGGEATLLTRESVQMRTCLQYAEAVLADLVKKMKEREAMRTSKRRRLSDDD